MNDKNALRKKKLFLLDMDGTIYLGNRLFDFSLAFFDRVTKMGARYMFLTNNSSKSAELYLKKLDTMQIPVTPDDLITSTHATIRYLKSKYGDKPIYASGTAAFCQELSASGLNITESMDNPVALVMGFDTELTFQKLENMCILLGKGIDYIGSNPDWTCPTEYGYVPDCGSVAQMLKNATGREPVFIGKPMADMVDMALERTGVAKADALIIGDRLYTDVACGLNAGIDAALVLSGESTLEDMKTSPAQPTYVFKDLGELLEILM
ncbi:MAG: HAD-IIA family hydrolase [Defluviitaleaceae bacterium]|nr:HAD-IIA family hydrolase [Defluviitaleaceae bacterium]